MEKLRNAIYKFMYGRYGNDQLNAFILWSALILALINSIFFKSIIITCIAWILLFIHLFRSFSKKTYRRTIENVQFLKKTEPIRKYWSIAKKQAQDKEHKYFVCPNCKQNVRVPKGKGKITITCPKCRSKFDRKS